MRLRIAFLALTSVALPVLQASPASAACTSTTKTLTGRLDGEDGRYVDALLGFDIMDRYGRHLDGRTVGSASYGCAGYSGYGQIVWLNTSLPATGATSGGTKTWKVVLPGNTAKVHIEVYPRRPNKGPTDESRYGHSYRRAVPVPYSTTANIRLPLVCGVGGSTGSFQGWVTKGGVRTKPSFIGAWSTATDSNSYSPILGWNVGSTRTDGYYKIPNLKTGQEYTILVTLGGRTQQRYHYTVSKCGLKNIYPFAF